MNVEIEEIKKILFVLTVSRNAFRLKKDDQNENMCQEAIDILHKNLQL
jgi:hypothetical protein